MKNLFYRWAAVLTLLLLAIFYGLDRLVTQVSIPAVVYGFVIVFSALTYLIHDWLLKANAKNPKLFITYFLGSISIKLFATLIFLVVYLYLNRDEKVPVGLGIFAVYASFTALEITSLFKKITSS